MAVKKQKIDFLFDNFTFKGGMTKKRLSEYPEDEIDKIISAHQESFEKWLNQPKQIKFMVDGTQDGKDVSWDIRCSNENEAKEILENEGAVVIKVVPAKGHHRCRYCGSIAEGTNRNILCEDCRITFGHYSYEEL